MQAKDLRIGNIVDYLMYDNLDERLEWYEPSIIDFEDISIIAKRELSHAKIPPDAEFKTNYKPIPITEEWLLKFEFESAKKKYFVFDRFRMHYMPAYKFWYINDFHSLTYITKVEFVHELQNVIYFLNGTELKPKQ